MVVGLWLKRCILQEQYDLLYYKKKIGLFEGFVLKNMTYNHK